MKTYGNPDLSTTKVIIFDFDETMYYSPTIKQTYIKYIKNTILTLNPMSEQEAMSLMDKHGFTSCGEKRISFGKNCEKFGVTKEQWDSYRIDNFFQIDYSNASIVPNKLYALLSKKYNLYIVSNEVLDNLRYKADKLHINLAPFKKVYAPTKQQLRNYCTKSDVYKQIKEREHCEFSEMIVVGDRYNVDIQPLEELGGSGVLSCHVTEIEEYFSQITDIIQKQKNYKNQGRINKDERYAISYSYGG